MTTPNRRYDDSVPAIEYVEEKLLRVFEEGLRETRDTLKQDIAALATSAASNAVKSTQEHAGLRADLERVRSDVNDLRRDVKDLKPLREHVAQLQEHDRTDGAVTAALNRNRRATEKNRRQARGWALALMSVVVTAAGVVVAIIAVFVH